MKKYRINNLDCAACAAKIEDALNDEAGVDSATVDFSTQLLHVSADDYAHVEDVVSRVDPEVELEPHTASTPEKADHSFDVRAALSKLLLSVFLFIIVLILDYGGIVDIHAYAFAVFSIVVYLVAGFSVIVSAVKTVVRKDFFDENVLMVIATAGAITIGAYSEAVAVMVFYKTGDFLQNLAVFRSRRSIQALMAQKPAYANLQTASGITRIAPESAQAGDVIVVKPGEKIPLDGRVISGASTVDPSVLTGESVPKSIKTGDDIMAGELNMTGVITFTVSRPYTDSSIAQMLEMVENASARKSATENFITVFARYYTPAMVAIAMGVAFLPPLLIADAVFQQWVYRALVLLVISCPCALVISIPLGYFGGIGRASRRGILVKGSNYLDALAKVKIVVFDKTGTLTEGVFHVKDVVSKNGHDPETVLRQAAVAQQHSNHPIAGAIVDAWQQAGGSLETVAPDAYSELSGMGVKALFGDKTIIVGNDRLMEHENIEKGGEPIADTVAHVAVNGIYAGYIRIGDRIKPDAPEAIAALRKSGIKQVVMLTGDNRFAAESIARRLDLDSYHADLLPEDKVRIFEAIQSENAGDGKIAFVGDGINDAPVIARADVGVAMGGLGSDAAVETADVVLMADSPGKMAEAVAIGRQTRVIVWQNIVLALSVKAIVIGLGAFGMATMWAAVFADVGTALLAVLNSTRLLSEKRASDVSKKPVGEQAAPVEPYPTRTV